MLTAAIPVDAVIPSIEDVELPHRSIIFRNKTDFPVPAKAEFVLHLLDNKIRTC